MNHLPRLLAVALLALPAGASVLAGPKPPAKPAEVSVEVAPQAVAPGGVATAVVRLTPKDGIRINRYPQIKVSVAEQDLVAEAKAAVGNTTPPPPDADPEANYYDEVDPVRIDLSVSEGAASGSHEIQGKLTYFYCVKASGFCAPKRTSISIPVHVR
jgi:hypothetical protein